MNELATGAYDPLDAIIAEYLQALETGKNPARAEFLARYPDLAERLRIFFADFDAVGRDASKFQLPAHSMNAETLTQGERGPANLPKIRYLGDYELVGEIARGGMGVVYRARQVSLNRLVAIKMILAGTYASEQAIQRFRAEAEAAANLDHPNILPIYEVGEHEGHQYFSMKLVEGGSLSAKITELTPKQAAELMVILANAVHFAHQRGILHRDLKPANVLLDTDGTLFITDFGLAKKVDADDGNTRTGAVVGTPSYMAPEQARGEKGLTTAVDVYSLGAILYELLTGQPPFRAGSVYETIQQVIETEPNNPRNLNPLVDRDLAAIALKCLAKDPAGRYGSAADHADDLKRWQQGEPTWARPLSAAGQAWRWLRRHTAAAVTVLVLGIVWGSLIGVALVTAQPVNSVPMAMLAEGTGPFNPVGWAWRVRQSPVGWYATLGAALTLTLTIGWWLRLGTNPKTSRAALGFASVTGLLATLIGFLFMSPVLAVMNPAQVHPVQDDRSISIVKRPDGTLAVTHPDQDYLVRFVPQEHRDKVLSADPKQPIIAQEHTKPALKDSQNRTDWIGLSDLVAHAQQANRVYAASLGIWIGQWFTLCFFLCLSLASMWAVDHPARIGRWWPVRLWCYIELYLPTVILLLVSLGLMAYGIGLSIDPIAWSASKLWTYIGPWMVFAGLVGTIYVGVIRGWHPLARVLIYVGYIVLMVITFALAL